MESNYFKKMASRNTLDNYTFIILAGGKGLRLRPLTTFLPKPMVKIKKKPIISYIINHLLNYNAQNIIVATGFKSNIIKNYIFKNYSKKVSNLRFSNSGNVDIIERIKKVISIIDNDIIIIYGDTISDININNLVKNKNKLVTAVMKLKINFGLYQLDKQKNIKSFSEKPVLDSFINIGYFCIPRKYFNLIYKFNKYEDFISHISKSKKMKAFLHDGFHVTVNTYSELIDAEKNIHKFS